MKIRILNVVDGCYYNICDCEYQLNTFQVEINSFFTFENKKYKVLNIERDLHYIRKSNELKCTKLEIYVEEIKKYEKV